MKETIDQAAMQELSHSYATVIDGELAYQRQAMLNMFCKGAEWQSKQSPWISVEERLPEDHTGVFFIVEWKDKRKNYYVGVYDGNQCWESDYRIFLPNSPLGNVTHWMKIPE